MNQSETIATDPNTGGQKAVKLARFSLIPPRPLWELAEHYGKGCKKYADRNWELGYKWGLSIDAMERHLNLFKQGQDFDPETGTAEPICVMWHAAALRQFMLTHPEMDDRVKIIGK